MADTLGNDDLGYPSRKSDKDVWIKREVLLIRKMYYLMTLVYVDGIMVVSKDTSTAIDYLANIHVLREGIIGPPDWYLGTNIDRVKNANGRIMEAMNSVDYCKVAIANMEKTVNAYGKDLSQYGDGRIPYPPIFHPEIDTSTELDENDVHDLQKYSGVLRCTIELGRIDIMTEVITLYQNLCAPRVNQLQAVYKTYHQMRKNMKMNPGKVEFYPTYQ